LDAAIIYETEAGGVWKDKINSEEPRESSRDDRFEMILVILEKYEPVETPHI
jgi:hypothetical protein